MGDFQSLKTRGMELRFHLLRRKEELKVFSARATRSASALKMPRCTEFSISGESAKSKHTPEPAGIRPIAPSVARNASRVR